MGHLHFAVALVSASLMFAPSFQAMACMGARAKKTMPKKELEIFAKKKSIRSIAQQNRIPFGGFLKSKWKMEAIIANAIDAELDIGYAKPNIARVVVSLPAHLHSSNHHSFPDNQTNARVDFGEYWKEKVAPVIARREIYKDGTTKMEVSFAPSLKVKEYDLQMVGSSTFIRPKGSVDSYVINTDPQVLSLQEFVDAIPVEQRSFSQGRKAPDPEGIFNKIPPGGTAIEVFAGHTMGEGYNSEPYPMSEVHARFPELEKMLTTAVGGGISWVFDRNVSVKGPKASFKHVYSCFDERNIDKETAAGVPSGAGWHLIGEHAETLLNTLEKSPLLIALGKETTASPKSGSFAYQLRHTISATRLQPDEVFVTRKGQFHWFAIESTRKLCAELWIHPCDMSTTAGWGFNCQ
jgi:hypothetical protein